MYTRRSFLRSTAFAIASLTIAPILGCSKNSSSQFKNLSSLLPADENNLKLPIGFTSRIVARSGIAPYAGSAYLWHDAPDGGATFSTGDGGWIYVSNSQLKNNLGGASALRFDASGDIISAYSILDNTSRSSAGGATPWNTWLSCEELKTGMVWECDPFGLVSAIPRPALGTFTHEAVAVDTQNHHIYMTEDQPDGKFYRFVPDALNAQGFPDLSSGTIEVAAVDSSTNRITWLVVPDPSAITQATRYQVNESTVFKGAEGIVFYNGIVSFATKGDNRIWSYNTATNEIYVLYNPKTHDNPILKGADNLTLTQDGEIVAAENGGYMRLIALTYDDDLIPLAQVVGQNSSQITGPAFSPDGNRLYFSSQRGTKNSLSDGITYEVTGPFHG